MMKKLRMLLAAILSVTMILTVIPLTAAGEESQNLSAQASDRKSEISNTSEKPYIVGELTEKRTENEKHFLMSDRTVAAAVYDKSVHYKSGGKWEDIDNGFSEKNDSDDNEKVFENNKNVLKIKFAKKTNKNKLASVKKDGYKIKWSLDGAEKSNAEVIANSQTDNRDNLSALKNISGTVIYKNILADVDLCYIAEGNELKENIILNGKNAPKSFTFVYDCKDLSARLNDDRQVEIYEKNDTDKTVFYLDAPLMLDKEYACSENIELGVENTSKGFKLTVTPDKEWISANERVYPITIDPTLAITKPQSEIESNYFVTNNHNTGVAFLYVGNQGQYNLNGVTQTGMGKVYSAVKVSNATLQSVFDGMGAGAEIINAKMALISASAQEPKVAAYKITGDWSAGNGVHSAPPTHESVILDYNSPDTGVDPIYWDITKAAREWHRNISSNKGILLKSTSEETIKTVKYFSSYANRNIVAYQQELVKPAFVVTYRNMIGLEDYWSYTGFGFSGGKTGGYVNNYNGNLVFSVFDTAFNSEINGFTVSHIYNSFNKIADYGSKTAVKYGNGWSINMIQRLQPVTVNGNESVKYVYTDGDGTKHYFVQTDDGSIADEDGLGYTYSDINDGELTRKLTDKDGNILKFDQWGYLRRIIDTNQNTISLNYAPIANVDNFIASITTSSGGNFVFNYDADHRLTSIVDNAGRLQSFEYTGGNLTKITYPDGSAQCFEYSPDGLMTAADNFDGLRYALDYDGKRRVVSLTERGQDYTVGTYKSFDYDINRSVVTDNKNRSLTYQFDTFGRVTCLYDNFNNSYSQDYTPTSNLRNGIFSNNKINISSNNIKYVDNLISNGSFSDGLTHWGQIHTNSDISVTEEYPYLSSKSVKIVNSGENVGCVAQNVRSQSGETYTFSGYIKTENVVSSSLGAGLEIVTDKRWIYSDFTTGTTDAEINSGFKHISVTFTLEPGETISRATAGLYNATGTVYINSLQLESGDTANNFNFITNSGFENDGNGSASPSGFTPSPSAYVCTDTSHSGSNSYRINGQPNDNLVATQTFSLNGKAGDVFTFGGWGKADSVHSKNSDCLFKLVLGINHSAGTELYDVNFNEYVSDWQQSAKTFIAKSDFQSVTLYICYYKNGNTAYFDDLFLYRDTAESYTYDGNGNVISVSDNAKQMSEYQYSNNSISRILNPTGTCYEYAYDNNKNLVISKNNLGLQYDIKYDSCGNSTSTSIYSTDSSATLKDGGLYYIRNKLSGKYMDVSDGNCVQKNYNGSNSQRWQLIKNTNGSYSLRNTASSQSGYLTVSNCESGNGTNLHTYIYHNNNAFILKAESLKIELVDKAAYKITTAAGNYLTCVGVSDNDTSEGANIAQWNFAGTDAQQWYFEKVAKSEDQSELQLVDTVQPGGIYVIRNKQSGKFLDYEVDGTNTDCIQQNLCQNSNTQKWNVYDNGDGTYRLRATDSQDNTYLCVYNAESASGTPIGIYGAYFGNDFVRTAESLKIVPTDSSCFKILTKASGYNCGITVKNASVNVGESVLQSTYTDSDSQKWEFYRIIRQPQDNGIYQLRARHSGRFVTVCNQETADGTKLDQYVQSYFDCQKFVLKKYRNTEYYTLTPVNALDKLVSVSSSLTDYGCEYVEINSNQITDSKLFKFNYNPQKDAYLISSKLNPNECIDVAHAELNNSANIITAENGEADNKYFIPEKVSETITASATYQDNGNYIHTTTDSRGKTTAYGYDTARGLQTSVTDANGNVTDYAYDSQNDRLLSVSSGNSNVNYTYNSVGRLNKITSPSKTQYNFDYDPFGKTKKIRVGNRTLTENFYEQNNGNLLYSLYGNGAKVGYTYDSLDRVTQKLYNDVVKVIYRYDKFGNLYSKNDLFTNVLYRYSYDLSGRTGGISGTDGTSVNFVYDDFSRVSKQTAKVQSNTLSTEYLYGNTEDGRLNGVLYGIKQNGQNSLSYSYDNLTRLNVRTVDGADSYKTEYTYLDGGSANTTTAVIKTVKNGNDIFEYSYDDVGNITEIKRNGTVTERYAYDSLNQLTGATYGGHTYTYTYDNGGNILTVKKDGATVKSYTYGDGEWKDLLTSFNGQTITYDGIGNPLVYRNGFNFTWSCGRQLTGITKGNDNISYLYNADGQRVQKTVNGTTTDYYYINGILQAQKTGDEYILFLYDENGSAYGMVIKNGTAEEYCYYLFNAQGDVIGIVNGMGEQVVSYEYGAWGDVTSITGSLAQTVGEKNPIRYRGYYFDSETGFYYLQSRYYDPEISRFINADGMISGVGGEILGYNSFAYCHNNPVNKSDETGNWPKWIKKAIKSVRKTIQRVINSVERVIKSLKSNNFYKATPNRRPNTGKPGSTYIAPNGDKRTYGQDGNPIRDWDHDDHGVPNKHPHDSNGGHNHDWVDGKRGPAYETIEPIVGTALIAICVIGVVVVAVDDLTGVGVTDDFLFVPLGTGIGNGIIMIFG